MTDPDRSGGRIEQLTTERCMELLTTTTIGRLAFVEPDGPQIVPVNFALVDDDIYFRTTPGGYLAGLARHRPRVAFGVDYHDDTYQNGWNVTVKGPIRQVEDRYTISKIISSPRFRPWAGGARPFVMSVAIDSIDGRHVVGH